jgi:hypothetical protein
MRTLPQCHPTAPAAVIALLFVGCASTAIHSQLDPQAAPRTYKKVLVLVAVRDFALQQEAERAFQARVAGRSTQLIPFHTLFFGAKDYSAQESAAIRAAAGIDATLIVTPTGRGSVST